MIIDKINSTVHFIATQIEEAERPLIACSFGKDSMVMLALAREVRADVPVLYLEAIAHPTKHAFANRIIRDWNLNIISPQAIYTDAIEKDNHVEIIQIHEIAPRRWLYFPIEAEPEYIPNAESDCGLAMATATPPAVSTLNYDSIFIGHRGDDIDPTFGAVPLAQSVIDCGDFRYIYPIREWTERDIWDASRLLNIPQNEARYSGDLSANNDYYPLCTSCMQHGPETVFCPKIQAELPRIGNDLNLGERREIWQSQFVNIQPAPQHPS